LRDTELGRVYGRWEIHEVKEVEEVKEVKEAEGRMRIAVGLRDCQRCVDKSRPMLRGIT
jgi:hypothetical protein